MQNRNSKHIFIVVVILGMYLHVNTTLQAKEFDFVTCFEMLGKKPELINVQPSTYEGRRWPILHQACMVPLACFCMCTCVDASYCFHIIALYILSIQAPRRDVLVKLLWMQADPFARNRHGHDAMDVAVAYSQDAKTAVTTLKEWMKQQLSEHGHKGAAAAMQNQPIQDAQGDGGPSKKLKGCQGAKEDRRGVQDSGLRVSLC